MQNMYNDFYMCFTFLCTCMTFSTSVITLTNVWISRMCTVCMGEWVCGWMNGWMPVCIYVCLYIHMMYENDYKLIFKN